MSSLHLGAWSDEMNQAERRWRSRWERSTPLVVNHTGAGRARRNRLMSAQKMRNMQIAFLKSYISACAHQPDRPFRFSKPNEDLWPACGGMYNMRWQKSAPPFWIEVAPIRLQFPSRSIQQQAAYIPDTACYDRRRRTGQVNVTTFRAKSSIVVQFVS